MTNSIEEIPFNPFISSHQELSDYKKFGVFLLPALDVPTTADGFDALAQTVQQAEPVLRALRDAAATIRFATRLSEVTEAEAIEHRLYDFDAVALALRAE